MIGSFKGVCLAFALGFPVIAQAQSYETGGIQLTFGTKIGLQTQSNATLSSADPGRTSTATSALSIGVLTETRSQRFAIDLGLQLRGANAPAGATPSSGFVDPFVAVEYMREVASARLSFAAAYRETDLSQNADLIGPTGGITIATGTATRRYADAEMELEWGLDTPVSYGILARVENTTYRDGAATGIGGGALNDTKRQMISASLQMDLNPVVRLRNTLSYRMFSEKNVPGQRQTLDFASVLKLDRPLGDLDLTLGYTDTPEGHRLRAETNRDFEMPVGQLRTGLGVARGVTGDTYVTGQVQFRQTVPRGGFEARMNRVLASSDQTDKERINTSVNIRYRTEISALSALIFKADWGRSKDTTSKLSTTTSAIGISYTRDVTRNLTFEVGLRHRRQSDDVTGQSRSNEVFIGLGHVLVTRY